MSKQEGSQKNSGPYHGAVVVSLVFHVFGILWLYNWLAGNKAEISIGVLDFTAVAVIWLVVSIAVFIHDLVVLYGMIVLGKNPRPYLIMTKKGWYAIFAMPFVAWALCALPGVLYLKYKSR